VLTGRTLALIALGLLAGCVRYEPAPIALDNQVAKRAAASFDPAQNAATVRRIAPASASTAGLDRLALFAALLDHDPKLVQARAAIASAEADARSSRHVVGPTFTLTAEYAKDPATTSPWLLGGAVNLPLDRGGQRRARLDRADLAVLMAHYDYAEALWTDRMALRRALIGGEIARRQIALGEEIALLRTRQIAALDRQVKAGELAGAAVSPFRSLQAQEARALEDARARALAARTAIAGILGVPTAAIAAVELRWPEFDAPRADPAVALTPELRAKAVAARADVLHALAAYDQTDADVRGEIAKQYPVLSLAPGYTWERGLVKLPLSINLALPTFDDNRAAIRAALARRDTAGAAIETAIAGAQAEIDAALVERRAAMAALERIRATELPQVQLRANQAQAQLTRGQIARADWADAMLAIPAARLAALDALARVQLADAALENGVRRPLEGPETMITPERLEAKQ